MASELKAVHIDMDLAPVVDVDSNPRNPVIGTVNKLEKLFPYRILIIGIAFHFFLFLSLSLSHALCRQGTALIARIPRRWASLEVRLLKQCKQKVSPLVQSIFQATEIPSR